MVQIVQEGENSSVGAKYILCKFATVHNGKVWSGWVNLGLVSQIRAIFVCRINSSPIHLMTVWVLCVPDVTCDVQWWTSEDECKWVLRHMIYSPETNMASICIYIINDLITFEYINKGPLTMLTLCTLGPLCHAWLFFPSSSCSMLPPSLLGLDCLSNSLSGGLALPLPFPGLNPFPSGPRQHSTLL
jgi:hypothetical protein